jgi:hypothetical protein
VAGAFALVRNCTYAFEVSAETEGRSTWHKGHFRVTKDGAFEPSQFRIGAHEVTLEARSPLTGRRDAYGDLQLTERPTSPLDEIH